MNHKISLVAAVALLCMCLPSAQAEEGLSWKFSGYGTLGAVHSSERNADFVASLTQPNGAGATSAWSAGVDSKLGGQIDARYGSKWSATAQVLTRHQYDNSYTPALSLGFVKWAPGAGVELRVGRIPYAAFVVSDYLNVGYSQPWVRPPIEVYGFAINHVDGADATWRSSVGDVGVKVQAMAGSSKQKNPAAVEFVGKGLLGISATADLGATTARLSYFTFGKASLNIAGVDAAFGVVRSGIPGVLDADPALADEFEYKNKRARYLCLGLSYDPGTWFVTGEFGHYSKTGFSAAADEFYVTAGVRLGPYTPYVSVAQFKHSEKLSTPGNFLVQGLIDASNDQDQKSVGLGLRWDFAKSADLKVQLDRFSNGTRAKGFLINPQPGFVPGGRYSVLSLAVDFVF